MKSMTGYGRGESARDGFKITVEVSSVNRRQAEIVPWLPRELEPLEPRIRDEVNRRVARGRVTVRVGLHTGAAGWAKRVRVNGPLAKCYARELRRLARELKLADPLRLDTLVRAPGVVGTADTAEDADSFWASVKAALDPALRALVAMREREGAHLARDLARRVSQMRRLVSRVRRQAPRVGRQYREQLLARLRSAGLDTLNLDDERLLKEVVLFADRSDISEELTRLGSHFAQFADCLSSGQPVGRTLDFLAQEMNREINTLGSKANDAQIGRAVVELKAEVERFREQVQNVE